MILFLLTFFELRNIIIPERVANKRKSSFAARFFMQKESGGKFKIKAKRTYIR